MAEFYSARSNIISPLQWTSLSPPFTLIDLSPDLPHSHHYIDRFGSIYKAYNLAGYDNGRFNNQKLLYKLKKCLNKYGKLTKKVINSDPKTPSASTYTYRFGSLGKAYQKINYKKELVSKNDLCKRLKKALKENGTLSSKIIDNTDYLPSRIYVVKVFGSLKDAYRFIGFIK